jgi:hypothetical protein
MGVKHPNRLISDETAAYCLMVLGAGCALFLLAQPRVVEPLELPGVVLPAAAVRAQIDADAHVAAGAPGDGAALTLTRLIAEHGQAEQGLVEDMASYRTRRKQLADSHAAVVAAHGAAGVDALRAQAVQHLERALEMELPAAELPAVMGAFADLLAHNRAVVGGVELAAPFVLRTLYKARWNLICAQPPVQGFSAVERLAYFGWMGLQSNRLSASEQVDALQRYRAEGGANARLALALLWLRRGRPDAAAAELSALQRTTPTLRLRNFLVSAELSVENAAFR